MERNTSITLPAFKFMPCTNTRLTTTTSYLSIRATRSSTLNSAKKTGGLEKIQIPVSRVISYRELGIGQSINSGWFPANYVQVCDQEDEEEDMLKGANDGKITLSTSFEITQTSDQVITIRDAANRKSMRIGKSNQKEGDAG